MHEGVELGTWNALGYISGQSINCL
jgi:hypothetical protein